MPGVMDTAKDLVEKDKKEFQEIVKNAFKKGKEL
jgi:hypothetical protein